MRQDKQNTKVADKKREEIEFLKLCHFLQMYNQLS